MAPVREKSLKNKSSKCSPKKPTTQNTVVVTKKKYTWVLEWSDSRITSLIEYYQNHPYLWNTKLDNYKNKQKKRLSIANWLKREGLYQSVAEEAGKFLNVLVI